MRVGREDIVCREVVFLPQCVVVHIVRGRYFQAARTELYLHIAVFYHRYLPAHQRHDDMLPAQPVVLRVFGVDTHRHIAHDGLGAGGRYHSVVALLIFMHHILRRERSLVHRLYHAVFQVEEMAVLIVVNHFLVGERRLPLGVPVDHAQAAVNQPLLIQVAEHADNCPRTGLIHRERGAVPVARATKFPQLLQDDAAVLVGPCPRVFQKLLARDVALVNPLLFQALDDLRLGGDGGMVGAGHPAGVLPLQARAAHKDVLYRLVEHMPHVKHARYIGGRDNHRERFTPVRLAVE